MSWRLVSRDRIDQAVGYVELLPELTRAQISGYPNVDALFAETVIDLKGNIARIMATMWRRTLRTTPGDPLPVGYWELVHLRDFLAELVLPRLDETFPPDADRCRRLVEALDVLADPCADSNDEEEHTW